MISRHACKTLASSKTFRLPYPKRCPLRVNFTSGSKKASASYSDTGLRAKNSIPTLASSSSSSFSFSQHRPSLSLQTPQFKLPNRVAAWNGATQQVSPLFACAAENCWALIIPSVPCKTCVDGALAVRSPSRQSRGLPLLFLRPGYSIFAHVRLSMAIQMCCGAQLQHRCGCIALHGSTNR
jgi:hypothetical protein